MIDTANIPQDEPWIDVEFGDEVGDDGKVDARFYMNTEMEKLICDYGAAKGYSGVIESLEALMYEMVGSLSEDTPDGE